MSLRRTVAFDTETHLFRPGEMAPKVVCLSWATEGRNGLEVGHSRIETWLHRHLDEVLEGKTLLVGHVVAYDAACILRTFPSVWDKLWQAYVVDGVACTAVRERLLDCARGEFQGHGAFGKWVKHGYSLGELAKRRLKKTLEKGPDTFRKRYAELDGVSLSDWPREAVQYAVEDAITTLALFEDQRSRATRFNYTIPTAFEDARADLALRLASVWGLELDQVQVQAIWDRTIDRMEQLVPVLESTQLVMPAAKKFGLLFTEPVERRQPPELKKSMTKLREAVSAHYPGGHPPKTATGMIKTDKEVIRECNFEPLRLLSEFNGLQKAANTYIAKLFVDVLHAQFFAVGAASDRTSSSGPNLQNQPRMPGIRECFRARAGTFYLACDFDAQEMRTLAQSCLDIVGSSKLAERFQADRHFDPHLEFAAMLAKISVTEAQQRKAEGDPRIKELRQQSKAANFGYPGGMGSERFIGYARGYGVTLTEMQSADLRESWFAQWPEMRDYFVHVQNVIGSAGCGQQTIPQSGFVRGNCGYSDTANGYFQTLAAHASKAALFEVAHRAFCRHDSYLYGSRPVLFIHDEIVLETPIEAGHDAAKELERTMIETLEKWTPEVPAAASATLMKRWSKKAEQTYDGDRLVAWDGGA